jgi:hypothetical protein
MKVRLPVLLILVLSTVSCGTVDSGAFTGNWVSDGSGNSGRALTKLSLSEDGSFYIELVPLNHACAGGGDQMVSGRGSWEYDQDLGRIFLIYQSVTPKSSMCSFPYVSILFIRSWLIETRIVIFPDGPDSPGSQILLSKLRQ